MNDRWVNVRGRWVLVPGYRTYRTRSEVRAWTVPYRYPRGGEIVVEPIPSAGVGEINWVQLTAGAAIGVLAMAILGKAIA